MTEKKKTRERDMGWFLVEKHRAVLPRFPSASVFRVTVCPPSMLSRVFRDNPDMEALRTDSRYVVYEFHPHIGEFYIADFPDEATAIEYVRETYGEPS